jgi:hypothetical protein
MLSEFGGFLFALAHQWAALLTSGILSIVLTVTGFYLDRRSSRRLSNRVGFPITAGRVFLLCVSLAFVWASEQARLEAEQGRQKTQLELHQVQTELSELKKQPPVVNVHLPPGAQESPRRRVLDLGESILSTLESTHQLQIDNPILGNTYVLKVYLARFPRSCEQASEILKSQGIPTGNLSYACRHPSTEADIQRLGETLKSLGLKLPE